MARDIARGQYILRLGGCASCHTNSEKKGEFLAGGRVLKTPFGTFHVPNITPDPDTGIGNWSDTDFIRAMTEGIGRDGKNYYPAFPFTSYTRMTHADLLDLKAYLDTVRPVRNLVPPHELSFPYNLRSLLGIWKILFFRPGSFSTAANKEESWNRGAYIVTGPGHCGECHTSRNFLGATIEDHALAGTKDGPLGKSVPNITPHPKQGIGLWSVDDITEYLKTGNSPFGDQADDPMDEVINNGTSYLTDSDLRSIAKYLLSLPPQTTP